MSGKLVFLSGQISKDAEGKVLAGKVGKELSLAEGQAAARLAALNVLSIMKCLTFHIYSEQKKESLPFPTIRSRYANH